VEESGKEIGRNFGGIMEDFGAGLEE
jgi:hypothetical protein